MIIRQLSLLGRIALLAFIVQGTAVAATSENWVLKDSNGKTLNIIDFRGKWVLVNFWATWCPPCLAEIPDLIKLRHDHQKEIVVIGIAVGTRNSKDVIDYVQKKGIPYPIVLGNEDITAEFGGLVGIPTSFLYSPSGKFIGIHEGPMTSADLDKIFLPDLIDKVFTVH